MLSHNKWDKGRIREDQVILGEKVPHSGITVLPNRDITMGKHMWPGNFMGPSNSFHKKLVKI